MITLILLLIFFIVLDVAALGWGYDSRDGINSPEWTRRQEWSFARLAHRD